MEFSVVRQTNPTNVEFDGPYWVPSHMPLHRYPGLFIGARANTGHVWLQLVPTSRSRTVPFRCS